MGETKNFDFRKWLPYLIFILLFICGGVWLYYMYNSIEGLEQQIKRQEESIKAEKLHIDSLNRIIEQEQLYITKLKDSVVVVQKTVIEEVEKIKCLPIDSNVNLLRNNLAKYGELYTESDTFPKEMSINDNSDTVVALSENNLIDVNCIVAKYEGSLQENELLGKIITEDSIIIDRKDSIILGKDFIISTQDSIFDANLTKLKKEAKKDKLKAGVIGGALGTSIGATIVGVLWAVFGNK